MSADESSVHADRAVQKAPPLEQEGFPCPISPGEAS